MALPSCGRNPTEVNDQYPTHTVGNLYTYGGKVWRYVRFRDAVTYVAGHVCTKALKDGTEVTNDISGGSSIGAIVGGICVRVMTQNYYGFVLVHGYYATVKTSGADDIAIGERVFVHGSTDGTCDGVVASTTSSGDFGIAVEADVNADNTVAVEVNLL